MDPIDGYRILITFATMLICFILKISWSKNKMHLRIKLHIFELDGPQHPILQDPSTLSHEKFSFSFLFLLKNFVIFSLTV